MFIKNFEFFCSVFLFECCIKEVESGHAELVFVSLLTETDSTCCVSVFTNPKSEFVKPANNVLNKFGCLGSEGFDLFILNLFFHVSNNSWEISFDGSHEHSFIKFYFFQIMLDNEVTNNTSTNCDILSFNFNDFSFESFFGLIAIRKHGVFGKSTFPFFLVIWKRIILRSAIISSCCFFCFIFKSFCFLFCSHNYGMIGLCVQSITRL